MVQAVVTVWEAIVGFFVGGYGAMESFFVNGAKTVGDLVGWEGITSFFVNGWEGFVNAIVGTGIFSIFGLK